MICLDTTFLIDFLENDAGAVKKAISLLDKRMVTTSINSYELLIGIYFKPRSKEEVTQALTFLDTLEILPLSFGASSKAAQIRASLMQQGKDIHISDSLVAGIMLHHNCSCIATRNSEHFRRIKGITAEPY